MSPGALWTLWYPVEKFHEEGKGDHSEQLCIDLHWAFPLRGQVNPNHASQMPLGYQEPPDALTGEINLSPICLWTIYKMNIFHLPDKSECLRVDPHSDNLTKKSKYFKLN